MYVIAKHGDLFCLFICPFIFAVQKPMHQYICGFLCVFCGFLVSISFIVHTFRVVTILCYKNSHIHAHTKLLCWCKMLVFVHIWFELCAGSVLETIWWHFICLFVFIIIHGTNPAFQFERNFLNRLKTKSTIFRHKKMPKYYDLWWFHWKGKSKRSRRNCDRPMKRSKIFVQVPVLVNQITLQLSLEC